eukprot:Filipodium_phascolosomae@DN166_c0_g1_i1.p2
MMRLLIVRHGEAAFEQPRHLTDNGRLMVQRLATYIEGNKLKPTKIFHSGVVRAQETAEIIGIKLSAPISKIGGLTPNDPVGPIVDKISEFSEDTMLVSHLPLVEELTEYLLPDSEEGFAFNPATIAVLSTTAEKKIWKLESFYSPDTQ